MSKCFLFLHFRICPHFVRNLSAIWQTVVCIVSAFFPRCLQFVGNSQHNYFHRSNHTRRGSRPFYYNELSGRSSSARSLSSSHHARSIQAPPPSTLHSITNCSYLSVYLPWYLEPFYLIGMVVGHIPLGH